MTVLVALVLSTPGPRKPPPAGFTVVVQPPFIVVGDEAPGRVRARALGTVKWAVDHLQKDFFRRQPAETIDVWLFKDADSYQHHARTLFGDTPDTPYGYYSERHHAMIMNIATGGGTLVHELVHPFMDADFPERPAWLNEGLGSLFEQSAEQGGHIVGLTNWRLPGLQRALRAGRVPSLRTLMALDEHDFYDDESGVHYAASRYLLYYLQERGLLVTFYRRFRDGHERDPSGYETLRAVLGNPDMAAFERDWHDFVLSLRFTAG